MAVESPQNSLNSLTSLHLANTPQVDDPKVYEALLAIHSAIEALATRIDDFSTGAFNGLDGAAAYLLRETSVVLISAPYLALPTDKTILVQAIASNVPVTLPAAADLEGSSYIVKQVLGSKATLIYTTGGELIDSTSSPFTLYLDESVELKSDGSNWYII